MLLEPSSVHQHVAIACYPTNSFVSPAFKPLPLPPSSSTFHAPAAQPSYGTCIQQQAQKPQASRVSTTRDAPQRPARVERFLHKMMRLLRQPDDDGFDIRPYIHWDSTGSVLVVPDEQALASNVCRQLFSQSNVSSFDKQLNNWGFLRYKPSPFDPRDTSEFARLGPRSRLWQHQSLTRDSTVEEVFAVKRKEDGMYKRRLMGSRSWSTGSDIAAGRNNVVPVVTAGTYPRRSTRTRNRPLNMRLLCTSDEDSSSAEDASRNKLKALPAPKLGRVYSAPPCTNNHHGRGTPSTLRRGSLDSAVHRTFRKVSSFDSFDCLSSRSPTRGSPPEPQLGRISSSAPPSHYTSTPFGPSSFELSERSPYRCNRSITCDTPHPMLPSTRPDELPHFSPWRRCGSSALSHFYDLTASATILAPQQIRRCVTPTRSTWSADDTLDHPAIPSTSEKRASQEMDGYSAAACLAKLHLGAQHHAVEHLHCGLKPSVAAR
ncbi:BQ5605_C003g02241 [Microbotryum silenes-dioicae]|uniref:BQ5605_C003g02241 protein n=1 Tax=Microbotryum silenes-dioicae TaxID=796604 RepID=A0A2X0P3W7_9BASI|nr:BQ5605_C003g02241 [Microbotryum silenes-dioicae]